MITRRVVRFFDERLRVARFGRKTVSYLFPDHWTFMLGEIALYCFLVLVATGVFLTMFFEPSTAETVYTGSYEPLHGRELSAAYASTVEISWDVRAGLLMRQTHHWAALVFVAAIVLHLCRIFFTGVFRKPREINWLVGVTLLLLALLNGFAGYSLPDDLLSGTGLVIAWSVVLSIPVVGAWLGFLLFGGEFPGNALLERLYAAHILLVPALIAVLITVHLAVVIRQKHTQFPGPGRGERNVVGSRMWPTYTFRSLSLLCALTAVLFALGGLAQINPIWVWGEFSTAAVTEPAQPDWYVGWLEGLLRLSPAAVEFRIAGHLVPALFVPGVLIPGVTFLALYAWPFLEKLATGDREPHHMTGRPRDFPVRTAIGAFALAFYGLMLLAGGQDVAAYRFEVPIGTLRAVLRVVVVVVPFVVAAVTFVLARALRDSGVPGVMHLGWRDIAGTVGRRALPEGEAAEEEPAGEAPGDAAVAQQHTDHEVAR